MTNPTDDPIDVSPIDSRPDEYVAHHDWDASQPLSRTLIDVLDAVPRVSLHREAALYEALDVEALETLFREGEANPDAEVRFGYQGCGIEIRGDGTITVRPGAERARNRSGRSVGD